jgi:DDE superfamily endonuclease
MWQVTQSIARHKEKGEREKCYSGYKHKHTSKNFVVLPKGEDIIAVMLGEYGPISDINLFREIQLQFNSKQTFKKDKAFIGGENISTPHKKPKGRELTKQQKEEDKILSGQRVFVEHVIRMVKIQRFAVK